MKLTQLLKVIENINIELQKKALSSVYQMRVIRNWLIVFYIVSVYKLRETDESVRCFFYILYYQNKFECYLTLLHINSLSQHQTLVWCMKNSPLLNCFSSFSTFNYIQPQSYY